MNEKFISQRIAALRAGKKVSARDMSLTIGQNENYINHIENGKALPSMQVFLYICDYFGISPKEFFDEDSANPAQLNLLMADMSGLDDNLLRAIHEIVKGLKH